MASPLYVRCIGIYIHEQGKSQMFSRAFGFYVKYFMIK